ncbi:uncharacterized protein VTP21DRAFT_8211 [Calcarisporiella thermophila]|uniref:uncharacterized protein n=1 Tax=Calcarisporiella thermophila TaxID=911321 RepID=UPI0037441806
MHILKSTVRSWLMGRSVLQFRPNAEEIDKLRIDGIQLHTALRYGLTQALLNSTALAMCRTMAEVISEEYGILIRLKPIDILASCHRGDNKQLDRMILKRVAMLPHASFNVVEDLGTQGMVLLDYARDISTRIRELGDIDYKPRIHLDVYGTLGEFFNYNIDALSEYLGQLARAAQPIELLIESPIIAKSRKAQIDICRRLRATLRASNITIKLVETNGATRWKIFVNSPMLKLQTIFILKPQI